jgi:hypothetical protein
MNAASFFYTEGVSEADAMRVATFLAAAGVFNDSPKVAQLNCSDEGFEFRLAVDVHPLTDEMDAGQQKMAADLSGDVLGGVPVQVHYCKGLAATLRTDRASVKKDGVDESVLPRGRTYRSKVFRVPHYLSGDDAPADP